MLLDTLLIAGLAFARNLVGIVFKPYETYRKLVDRGSLWEMVYLGILLCIYLAISSLVKTASFRPFLLTRQFLVLALAVAFTFILVVGLLYLVAKLVGGKGTLKGLTIAWTYTLIPTLAWFLSTSILYLLLPPPRSARPLGIIYSLLYLVFSATLFWWKMILAYLTLRFGMRLDLVRILLVAVILLPLVGVYSLLMYRWGIFKVPFL